MGRRRQGNIFQRHPILFGCLAAIIGLYLILLAEAHPAFFGDNGNSGCKFDRAGVAYACP